MKLIKKQLEQVSKTPLGEVYVRQEFNPKTGRFASAKVVPTGKPRTYTPVFTFGKVVKGTAKPEP